MIRTSRRSSRAIAWGLLIVLTAFAASPVFATEGVATLGSPPPEEEPSPAAAPIDDPMDAMLDYAACMREHGVDMPDPMISDGMIAIGGAGGLEEAAVFAFDPFSEEYLAAEEACRDVLPFVGVGLGITDIGTP